MLIQEHVWVFGKCIICGGLLSAGYNNIYGLPSCRQREDHIASLRPEPKRRELAHENADEITRRLAEIRKEHFQEPSNDGGYDSSGF